jgi:CDP-diacylglycerol--glycerol-3-phosphate 3-phosphatidyltransferase
MADLQAVRRSIGKYFTEPIVRVLEKTPITPDALTWCGALIAVAAGVLAGTGHTLAGGLVVLFSGLFDLLDGALARKTNKASRFGAVLDSTLDRVGEAAVLLGIVVLFAKNGSVSGVIVSGVAIIGSQLVSYIRARAEGMGLKCEVGVFTRPERIAILSLGLLLAARNPVLLIAMGLTAILSWITAGQRLLLVWQKTKSS